MRLGWCIQSLIRHLPPCNRRNYQLPPAAAMGKAAKGGSQANSTAAVAYTKDESYLQTVVPKRIALFESIQNEQRLHRLSLSADPIKIELPDGTVKEGRKWNTTPLDVAKEISKSLASNALISKVNGVLWDLLRPLEGNCKLELFKFDTDEGRDTFWHSSAHILGESLERKYGCKLCIGPCTTRGEGFYYDAFYGDLGLNEDHFQGIEEEAAKAVSEKQPFERIEVSRQQALDMFSDNRFKVEIIKDLPEDKTITVYRCGPLVDLCRGPHIPNTSFVKALACTKASSAYWRGDKDRESLQRVYGISYPDRKQLKEYMDMLEEAKKYDHRELTKKQELFFFHPLSPGSCFFLPHGARVCNKLMEFIKSQYWKRGYEEVWSPNMYNMQLWETSGHAANYKENMFVFEIEKQEFGLKPMNCPGHCLIFDHRVRSYRELPLRLADFGVLHRNEASGALTGLTRVRRFQQDDAHIFCRESQIKDEVKGVLDFISYVYKIFGFTFDLKLSTRPEKYLGDLESWDKAEAALSEALNEFGKPWEIDEGDGAFYGPKIDISVSDAMKRKFQCATLQLDFQLPQRFNLSYSAEDESKRERPVMIHRAILGSVEHMFAILLEHFKGKWPFWLSPRQAMVCPVSDKSQSYALESIVYLSSLLKRVDWLLQFDRLMPSYNGILTISCIRSLTQIALKLSEFVPLDRVIELINPFRTSMTLWKVRVEASRSRLDLEFQRKGIDATLKLFIRYLNEEPTIRGQVKLAVHAMRLCQIRNESDSESYVESETLVAVLRLLESPISFNNVILRHYLFCILQVLARRAPTLYGVLQLSNNLNLLRITLKGYLMVQPFQKLLRKLMLL